MGIFKNKIKSKMIDYKIKKGTYKDFVDLMKDRNYINEYTYISEKCIKIENNKIIISTEEENLVSMMGINQNSYNISYNVYMKLYQINEDINENFPEINRKELIKITLDSRISYTPILLAEIPYFYLREKLLKWKNGIYLNKDSHLTFTLNKKIKIDSDKSEIFIEADVWEKNEEKN